MSKNKPVVIQAKGLTHHFGEGHLYTEVLKDLPTPLVDCWRDGGPMFSLLAGQNQETNPIIFLVDMVGQQYFTVAIW